MLCLCLTALVVVLGAYVRLNDAGLGCPDWPGCYGQLTAPASAQAQERAAVAFPGWQVDARKAWIEMVHRYAAGTLGLAVLALWLASWRRRTAFPVIFRATSALLALVCLQAMLGMWTVTLRLQPIIVTGHLFGGMATLGVLVWINWLLRRTAPAAARTSGGRRTATPLPWFVALLLLALAVQVILGGWTSANNAALACGGFPTCQGQWLPTMDFGGGFDPARPLVEGADAMARDLPALAAIHWTHRLGALAVLACAMLAAALAYRDGAAPRTAAVVLGLVALQILLGIANVVLAQPLSVAVLHNANAAALVAASMLLALRVMYARRRKSR